MSSEISETDAKEAAKDFGASEREKVKSRFGCFMGLGLFGTALIVIFGFLGMTKVAALFFIAPLLLVIAPIYWWFSMRTLKAAVGRKNPKAVVEMFLKNLKQGFDENSESINTDFAFECLSMEARQTAGSPDSLREQWQGRLREILNDEVQGIIFTGACHKCGLQRVALELNRSVLGDFEPSKRRECWVRCANCKTLFCSECEDSLLQAYAPYADRQVPCAVCGNNLSLLFARGNCELIVLRDNMSPYLSLDSTQKVESNEERTLITATFSAWLTKGLVNAGSKSLAMLVTKVSMDYQLQKIEGQWLIDNGLPPVSKLQIKDYEKRLTTRDIYIDEF
ncbi:MAG: hypothetical protein ACKVRN_13330 [Pyrinomonadaceae bacterium]